MKLILFFLLSTSLYASNATLSAMGQPKEGSFYLSDTVNSFSNPEELNIQKN